MPKYYFNGSQKTIAACACQLQVENTFPEVNYAFGRMVGKKYPHAEYAMADLAEEPHLIQDALFAGFRWGNESLDRKEDNQS